MKHVAEYVFSKSKFDVFCDFFWPFVFCVFFSVWQILEKAYFFTPKLRDSACQLSPGASNCELYGGDGRL